MAGHGWRVRGVALAGAIGFVAVALGIRALAGDGMLDGARAPAQYSGTALYGSMVYAGVFLVRPGAGLKVAGAAAVAFCWFVEFLQLTGVPAELSERSLVARLVLGARFDAVDLVWYVVGVVPLAVCHAVLARRRARLVARG